MAHTICAATAGIAWHQTFPNMLSADPLDMAHSDLVVVWGANPSTSNTHLTPLLTAARARGAAVVVIDPRRTPTAARADLHLAVRPGTDAVLGLALATELDRLGAVDRDFCRAHADGWDEYLAAAADRDAADAAAVCGVDPADITALARLVGHPASRDAAGGVGHGAQPQRRGRHPGRARPVGAGRAVRPTGRRGPELHVGRGPGRPGRHATRTARPGRHGDLPPSRPGCST